MPTPYEDRAELTKFRTRGGGEPLSELLQEALSPYIPERYRDDAFAAIEETLEAQPVKTPAKAGAVQVFEVLRSVFGDTRLPLDVRRLACSAGIGAGDPYFNRPYQHYADMFVVTRACIHADARDVQRKFGVRTRRDKSDEARARSKNLAHQKARANKVKNTKALALLFPKL